MCQQALPSAPFATFSRGTLIFFAVVQVIGLKWVLQHLQNSGFVEVPPWVPFIDRSNCGLYKPLEYIVTSRKVITPDGTFPAAGEQSFSTAWRFRGSRTLMPQAIQSMQSVCTT